MKQEFRVDGGTTLEEMERRLNAEESGGWRFVDNAILQGMLDAVNKLVFEDAGLTRPRRPLKLSLREIPRSNPNFVWTGRMLIADTPVTVWAYRDPY